MDDHRLEELFRDAPGDPPAARFDLGDVTAASRRATARRRGLVAAVAAAVVALGGGTAGTAVLLGGDEDGTIAATRTEESADESPGPGQPGRSPGRPSDTRDFPRAEPKQGGPADGERTSGCEKVDRELATALAGELPAADSDAAPRASAAAERIGPGRYCPDGTRSASVRTVGATVTAVLAPPDTAIRLPSQPAGARTVESPTGSGGTLYLVGVPEPGALSTTHGQELDRAAEAVAGRF